MEIRHFIKLVTLTLGLALISLLITTDTQAKTTVQNNFSCANVQELPQLECAALVSVYNSTDGPNWVEQDGWLTTNTPCSWYGVTCSDGSVTEINLNQSKQGNGLFGALPTSIKYLTNLTNLDLGHNHLNSIPAEIGDLSNLTTLFLNGNQLIRLPSRIGELSNLTQLSLSANQLTSVPAEIGSLSNLVLLTLWGNHLNKLPAQIGNLSSLEKLYLSSNRLSSLPAEIGNLSSLKVLYVDANQLSSIPAEISSLQLDIFHLGYNRITNLPPGRQDTTQTVAPTNLAAVPLSESSIQLIWEPIIFQSKHGAYEISYGTTDNFTIHGVTVNKSNSSYTITGLAPGTNYFFRVRTYTLAHDGETGGIQDDQYSDLWSEYSEVISGHTDGPTPVPPTATPSPTFTPSSTSTPTSTSTDTPTDTPTTRATDTPTVMPTHTPTFTLTDTPTGTPTNTATDMPTATNTSIPTPEAAPTATPPVCYRLTRSTDGSGKVPLASPSQSPGCANRHYTAGEFIQLTARPATEWITDGWIGTDDDNHKGNSNTFTMPPHDHIIVARYTQLPPTVDVEPLAVTCPNNTPAGAELQVACLVGMVYFNGKPAENIKVTITNRRGEEVSIYTQKRTDRPEKRPYYLFELNSDPLLIEDGQEFNIYVSHNGISQPLNSLVAKAGHQQIDIVLSSSRQDRPIATINHLPDKSFDKDDQLIAYGMGQVQHRDSRIQAYRWKSNRRELPLGEAETLNYSTVDLEHGDHILSFQVQDSRGVWSNSVQQDIYVSNQPLGKWTMLLYLAADNDIDGDTQWSRFDTALTQISMGMNNPNLRVAALVDGYKRPPKRWTIQPGAEAPQTFVEERFELEKMDEPTTLTDFIKWGQDTFPAEHYYLVIAAHGQGVQGIAWDTHSDERDDYLKNNSAYLTVNELQEALDAPDVDPIDVLHLDACSMNLLETAYEVRESVTDVLISSQYLGWDFFPYNRYADLITNDTTPIALGKGIVQKYSQLAEREAMPYTLSILDMKHSPTVLDALDELAGTLAQRPNGHDSQAGLLTNIRENVQTFDSDGRGQNDRDDLYIDLRHWATLLQKRSNDLDIKEKAGALIQELDRFIIEEKSSSNKLRGRQVDLENAFGVSILYPEDFKHSSYLRYRQNELFEFTQYSQWIDFLEALPRPTSGLSTTLLPEPGPLAHLEIDEEIMLYLPIIQQ